MRVAKMNQRKDLHNIKMETGLVEQTRCAKLRDRDSLFVREVENDRRDSRIGGNLSS